MNLALPEGLTLHTSPQSMSLESLVNRLYGGYNVRGPYYYPRSPYAAGSRSGVAGLGLDYYDLLAQAKLQDCDPMDSACVSDNVAKQAAVEDLWANRYMSSSAGAPAGTVLSFTPQTAAQVTEFYDPINLVSGGNVVDDKGIMLVNGVPFKVPGYVPPVAPAKPNQSVAPKSPLTPMDTGFQNTAVKVADQFTAPPQTTTPALPPLDTGIVFDNGPGGFLGSGNFVAPYQQQSAKSDNTKLILGVAAAAALLFFMGGNK